MIGQQKLLTKLNKYTVESLPHSILFEGEKGCGKHLMTNYLSVKLGIPIVDMTELIDNDFIENTYINTSTTIYMINTSNITERQENAILKFLEEPPKTAKIIILTEDKNFLLPTIVNRCVCIKFDNYSTEELQLFISDTFGKLDTDKVTMMLNVARTPGKLMSLNNNNLEDIFRLCFIIPEEINHASLPNTLSISNRLNYKDDFSKVDVDVFLKLLNSCLLARYKQNRRDKYITMYKMNLDVLTKLRRDFRLNKQDVVCNLLSRLWEVNRCQ